MKLNVVLRAMFVMALQGLSVLTKADGQCNAPDAAKMTDVTTYVMRKYQIASASNLTLKSSVKSNDACFWKIEYTASSPQRSVVVYLSPDRKYLAPLLFDLTLDPVAEMREKNEDFSRELEKGASPPLGNPKTPVTIVEFSDFECPYCRRLADALEKDVLTKEGDKVHVVFRYYPLPMHPWAKDAAEIAECVRMQRPEEFWAMHDFFFQNQQGLRPDDVKLKALAYAGTLKGIDQTQLASCVDRELALGPVTQDQQLGQKLGVSGTPAMYINGVRFDGARSGDEINRLVEQAARGELVSQPEMPLTVQSPAATRGQPPASQCAPRITGGGR